LTIEVIGKFLKPFLITTWYRPPANEASILDNFENYLQSLEKEDKESIILGDFICNIESFSDPNDMWHTWKTLFNNVLDNHAPVRTKREGLSQKTSCKSTAPCEIE
jgi:exonuclease III